MSTVAVAGEALLLVGTTSCGERAGWADEATKPSCSITGAVSGAAAAATEVLGSWRTEWSGLLALTNIDTCLENFLYSSDGAREKRFPKVTAWPEIVSGFYS